jgi:hypothetical protein
MLKANSNAAQLVLIMLIFMPIEYFRKTTTMAVT